jgi:hypothetical protein
MSRLLVVSEVVVLESVTSKPVGRIRYVELTRARDQIDRLANISILVMRFATPQRPDILYAAIAEN